MADQVAGDLLTPSKKVMQSMPQSPYVSVIFKAKPALRAAAEAEPALPESRANLG
jgi:hypothetical protein